MWSHGAGEELGMGFLHAVHTTCRGVVLPSSGLRISLSHMQGNREHVPLFKGYLAAGGLSLNVQTEGRLLHRAWQPPASWFALRLLSPQAVASSMWEGVCIGRQPASQSEAWVGPLCSTFKMVAPAMIWLSNGEPWLCYRCVIGCWGL